MTAALALWERDVVAPAAAAHLGQPVARIELAGSVYSCRPVAGRRDRRMSEHARANAADIGGFTLADVCSVRNAWRAVELGDGDLDCDGTQDAWEDSDGDQIDDSADNLLGIR